MKKKLILITVIGLCMLLLPLLVHAEITSSGFCGDNVTWTMTDTGVLTISGTGPTWDRTWEEQQVFTFKYSIKSVVIKYGVTSIGSRLFSGSSNLTSVTIPNSVTSINDDAFFWCDKLKSITIPNSVKTIGEFAFGSCSSLTSLTIPGSVRSIGYQGFSFCNNLTDVTFLGGGSTSIGDSAFFRCENLKNLTISDGVVSIGDIAFCECNGLTSITIPDSVTSLNNNAFYNCSNLTSITFTACHSYTERFAQCNSDYDVIIKKHASVVKDKAVPPTCETSGLSEGSHCASCGMIIEAQKSIAPLGHTTVVDPGKDPTCSEEGLTEGSHCAVCGTILKEQEVIPKLDHTIVQDKGKEPTCTETGLTEGEHCAVCGEILEPQEVIPAYGHTIELLEAEDPTCTETGLTEGQYCEECGAILVAQKKVPALGHTLVVDEAEIATCTEDGLTEGMHCSVCGETIVEQKVIPAFGHTIVVDKGREATYTQTGLTEGEHCSVCGEIIDEQYVIPKLTSSYYTKTFFDSLVCSFPDSVYYYGKLSSGSMAYVDDYSGLVIAIDQDSIVSNYNDMLSLIQGRYSSDEYIEFTSDHGIKMILTYEPGSRSTTTTFYFIANSKLVFFKLVYSTEEEQGIGFSIIDSICLKTTKPTISYVQFSENPVTVKQDATIIAETSLNTVELRMYSGSTLIKSWTSGYADSYNTRNWGVTYAFAGTGSKTMTFKAVAADGTISAGRNASVTVESAPAVTKPTLSSVAFSRASATVKQDVTITAVTNTSATKLCMYLGSTPVRTWTSGYTDKDGKRTWKVKYAFTGSGSKTLTFKALDSSGNASSTKNASIKVTAVPVFLTDVIFSKDKATAKQNITITAITNTAVTKLSMYSGSTFIKSWSSGYTDSNGKRTWKVTYAFAGTGGKTMTFRAYDANGVTAEESQASIVITAAPTLTSVTFSRTAATVKQDITITAATNTNAAELRMYSGSALIKSWTKGYTDSNGKRTWKLTYAFAGTGSKTITFKAVDANGAATEGKDATIVVTAAPTSSSVQFSRATATVNQNITITAVTNTNASKLSMYSGTTFIKSWTEGYTDSNGKRTWKVTYAFAGTGSKTMTFRAYDANGVAAADQRATIVITAAPKLNSVSFPKATATVKQNITITAVTNITASKLSMYSGSTFIKSWSSGYTDSNGKRTWKVTYAFAGTGSKTMTFKAYDANGVAAAEKQASITITAAPTLSSVTLSRAAATVNQNITITAVTNTTAEKLSMYAGGSFVKSWNSGYTDSNGKRTWKITYAFVGKGDKTLTFKAYDGNGVAAAEKQASISITAAPTLSSASFPKATATVKQNITITAVTNTTASKLSMYSGSTFIKSWSSGYTDSNGKRTWKVTYAFAGTGSKTMTFKAYDANGVVTAEKQASITITAAPTLSSVSFPKASATVKQNITITAVTNTTVSKLSMYSGSSFIKSWTDGYTDSSGKRTWKITYAFAGTGDKTLTFKAYDANGVAAAEKQASITITAAPTLSSASFSKAKATVNQNITITAVTNTTASKLSMYSGGSFVKSWTDGYTDSNGKRTWKITYAFVGTGDKTLTFKAYDGNGVATAEKQASISITAAPTLSSVSFSKATATVNTNITITAVTNTTASKLTMYSNGSTVQSWTSGYTDSSGKRTWKITYAFVGTGSKTLTFKATDANGVSSAEKQASITITAVPTLSSVAFSKSSVTVNQKLTITAVTNTAATKLSMYSGSSLVKSWTDGYTDKSGKRTWEISYTFVGTGSKTLTFKASDGNGVETEEKETSINVTAAPTLSSVSFSKSKATVNTNITITAVTNTTASKLTMYSNGSTVQSWTSGYTDSSGKRTWKITYAFVGTGSKTLTFKAFDANGVSSAEKQASITITPVAKLNSVKFSASSVAVGENVTITATTSTGVAKLCMYNGSSLAKSWTSGYTDSGSTRTWTVTYAFVGAGAKTLTFKGFDADGTASGSKEASITVNAN